VVGKRLIKEREAMPRLPLSDRQWQFIAFLNAFIGEHGRSPTFREIALGLGVTSKGTVSTMVERLEAKGVLDRRRGLRPSIR
jgi:DNA-binding MarR family transcriptional regulator